MSVALATRIAEDFEAASLQPSAAASPRPSAAAVALNEERRARAIHALKEQGLPTSRDENWKYVNLRPLEKVRFAPATQTQTTVAAEDLPVPIAGYARYIFIDGVYAPALSTPIDRAGVRVTSLATEAGPARDLPVSHLRGTASGSGAAAAPATDAPTADLVARDLRFALLSDAFATDGASIHIDGGTDCQSCVELVFVATTDARAGASYPRVEFHVDAGARVGLIERHVSIGSDANFVNSAVNVSVARDATVQHYRVQQTGARAIWFDTLSATLAENAKYQVHAVNLGALSARSTMHVQLIGQRSEVGLYNVSVGGKNQVHDTFAVVEHVGTNAKTDQSFRGISSGRARVAFNGKIVVRKEAHGTDSRQSLRGLLAGDDAEIDVRPQLEIYTDDVRCSHGATAGKLDDNMLFYLLSRGLDRDTALRLLKWAFLEDVVAKIEVPELRRQIEQSLAGQMNEAAVLKGSPYTAHGELHEQVPWDYGERATPAKQELL
jgi:Fe-S cluster assembly protein SufD